MMRDKTCPTGRDIIVHVLPILAAQCNLEARPCFVLPCYSSYRGLPGGPSRYSTLFVETMQKRKATLYSLQIATVYMRTSIWAMVQEPYVRDNVPKNQSTSVPAALWNAWNLLLAWRGIGWNWSTARSSLWSRFRRLYRSHSQFLSDFPARGKVTPPSVTLPYR
ncbi:hypothetical protein EDD16DRAFT_1118956 [Pisolithus croceorrhizus]|nr:hypothetical protein EDD16DRAFT_1118956 [Pisolithus croceorrhizus]